MTKVLLDGQIFSMQRRGGVSKVMANIIHEYLQDESSNGKLSIRLGVLMSRYSDIDSLVRYPVLKVKTRRTFTKVSLIVNWLCLWIFPYQIVHSTHYFHHYLRRRPKSRHVVTLHDMIPEDYPEYFMDGYPHFGKKQFLEDADVIVCVSEYTKARLLAHFPELSKKVTIIYNGVSIPNLEVIEIANSREKKSQFLYVGDRGSYKDFNVALKAFSTVKKSHSDVRLLCIGGKSFSHEELLSISKFGLEKYVSQEAVSESELQIRYRESLATLITSRVEGFGLPLLEAFANRCLVIATDIPVFREIGKDAFLSFPPGDIEELVKRMEQAIEGKADFDSLKLAGFEIAKTFTWKRMYCELASMYQSLGDKIN